MRIIHLSSLWRGWIVVDVKDLQSIIAEQIQAGEGGSTLEDVIDIEKQAGFRMSGFSNHKHDLAQS